MVRGGAEKPGTGTDRDRQRSDPSHSLFSSPYSMGSSINQHTRLSAQSFAYIKYFSIGNSPVLIRTRLPVPSRVARHPFSHPPRLIQNPEPGKVKNLIFRFYYPIAATSPVRLSHRQFQASHLPPLRQRKQSSQSTLSELSLTYLHPNCSSVCEKQHPRRHLAWLTSPRHATCVKGWRSPAARSINPSRSSPALHIQSPGNCMRDFCSVVARSRARSHALGL